MKNFKKFGLNPDVLKGLDELGFSQPSPIQAEAIPQVLKSKDDLIALAQTGTGKTAAFVLPIINLLKKDEKNLRAIILCPTRELCLQITSDIKKLSKYSKNISTGAVYGGERIDLQIKSLKRGVNIVVGTPGRVNDLIRRKVLKLGEIKWLVLDEADEMLDMGFKEDLDAILATTPKTKQTLLFSATMSENVRKIAGQYMKNPKEISVGEKNIGAKNVSHEYYVVNNRDRFEALKRIIDFIPDFYGILFCRTRRETQEVAEKLKSAGYDAEAIHGDIAQSARTKIMDSFKKKNIKLLIATDVAARGIDVNSLTHVINYNLPDQDEGYTHRSGRTGRANKTGISISVLSPREVRRVSQLEKIIGKSFERKQIPGAKEIIGAKINAFVEKIENTEDEIEEKPGISEAIARLSKINKEDLIRRILKNEFDFFLNSYSNIKDINSSEESRGKKTLNMIKGGAEIRIPVGKKQGLTVKDFFAALNRSKKLKGLEIGKIKILDNHSFFMVNKNDAKLARIETGNLDFRLKRIKGRDDRKRKRFR